MTALAPALFLGNATPIPAPNAMFSHYANLPANASCEVLIAVAYSSVNPSDISPTMATNDRYPKPMGSDAAGKVIAVHPKKKGAANCEASGLMVGDNVWGDIGANTAVGTHRTKELGGYAQFAKEV